MYLAPIFLNATIHLKLLGLSFTSILNFGFYIESKSKIAAIRLPIYIVAGCDDIHATTVAHVVLRQV